MFRVLKPVLVMLCFSKQFIKIHNSFASISYALSVELSSTIFMSFFFRACPK